MYCKADAYLNRAQTLLNLNKVSYNLLVLTAGLNAYFSRVTYVGHDLYVGILQDQVTFPSSIGEMNDATMSRSFFKALFKFRDNVKLAAHAIPAKIHQSNKPNNAINDKYVQSRGPEPEHPSSDTWYTPPKNNHRQSVFPYHNQQVLAAGPDAKIRRQ